MLLTLQSALRDLSIRYLNPQWLWVFGFYDVWFRLKGVEGVEHHAFTREDCIRHPLVKRILKTYEDEHEIKL